MTLCEFFGEICLTDRGALPKSVYKEVRERRDREREREISKCTRKKADRQKCVHLGGGPGRKAREAGSLGRGACSPFVPKREARVVSA